MKRVAEALGVSRSSLSNPSGQVMAQRPYQKTEDALLLPRIRALVDERSTSTATAASRPFLTARPPLRASRASTTSDSFEIRCWNGERVQVVFSLDCHDREAMAYVATTSAITGEMVRDLMAQTLEHRFGAGARKTPHPVERLSDNGPPYTAHETCEFGRSLGLLICTMPAYSPESNGMAEAFVKGFKRDYVYVSRLESAKYVMAQLPGWLLDYNTVHPHKGLGMRSPHEFRAALPLTDPGRGLVTLEGLHKAIAQAQWFSKLGTFTPRAGFVASRDLVGWGEALTRSFFIFAEPAPILESGVEWLPTSQNEPDPVHGEALREAAEKQGSLELFRRARLDVARATYSSLSTAADHPLLHVEPHSYEHAARGAAVFAMRMAASEIAVGVSGFWSALVPLYAEGHWPYGRLPSGEVAVL